MDTNNKLNQLRTFVSEEDVKDVEILLIKEPVLEEIAKEVEAFFKDKPHRQQHRDQYTIYLMAKKIKQLDLQVTQWKKTATKHQLGDRD